MLEITIVTLMAINIISLLTLQVMLAYLSYCFYKTMLDYPEKKYTFLKINIAPNRIIRNTIIAILFFSMLLFVTFYINANFFAFFQSTIVISSITALLCFLINELIIANEYKKQKSRNCI